AAGADRQRKEGGQGVRVAVLGAGAFGTAMALTLARTGAEVGLWTRQRDHAAEMRRTRRNAKRLAGVNLPESVSVSAEIGDFRAAELLLVAVAKQQLTRYLSAVARDLESKAIDDWRKGTGTATGRRPR